MKLVTALNREGMALLNLTSKVNLWIRDTLSNELWTVCNRQRISVEAGTDIIGYCCSQGQPIVVPNAKDSIFVSRDFEEAIQQADPENHQEREFVVAIPIKHPRLN